MIGKYTVYVVARQLSECCSDLWRDGGSGIEFKMATLWRWRCVRRGTSGGKYGKCKTFKGVIKGAGKLKFDISWTYFETCGRSWSVPDHGALGCVPLGERDLIGIQPSGDGLLWRWNVNILDVYIHILLRVSAFNYWQLFNVSFCAFTGCCCQ
jgi:hypothetical protein